MSGIRNIDHRLMLAHIQLPADKTGLFFLHHPALAQAAIENGIADLLLAQGEGHLIGWQIADRLASGAGGEQNAAEQQS